jgi:sulfatase modifying factor 1
VSRLLQRASATRRARPFARAVALSVLVASWASAEVYVKAPPEARAQVDAALAALKPFFSGRRRALAAGSEGSIESAIMGYAPGRVHPVDEGALPIARRGLACPPEMVSVEGRFCVDRYEASVVERLADGGLRPHEPFLPLDRDRSYVARSERGVVPQAYVSGKEAARACAAANKRLCAPVEWRSACGGSSGAAFPYGPARQKGRCRDSGAAPMLVFHAATMKRGWGLAELNDPRNVQLDGTVAKTGSHEGCVNDYGAFDMVGNLHEWTSDPNGTFQGGYWLDTKLHGEGCAYRTIAHPFDYHDYSTGFRCCADGRAD